MSTATAQDLISVAEVASLLDVSQRYVREVLMRKHILRPVTVPFGKKYVFRARAEAYLRKRRRIARKALRGLIRISQRAGL